MENLYLVPCLSNLDSELTSWFYPLDDVWHITFVDDDVTISLPIFKFFTEDENISIAKLH